MTNVKDSSPGMQRPLNDNSVQVQRSKLASESESIPPEKTAVDEQRPLNDNSVKVQRLKLASESESIPPEKTAVDEQRPLNDNSVQDQRSKLASESESIPPEKTAVDEQRPLNDNSVHDQRSKLASESESIPPGKTAEDEQRPLNDNSVKVQRLKLASESESIPPEKTAVDEQRPLNDNSVQDQRSKLASESESIPSERTDVDEQRPLDFKSVQVQRSSRASESESILPERTDVDELIKYDFRIDQKDIEHFGQCIECVKAIPVFSYDDIEIGDHITYNGRIYDHHAIVSAKFGNEKIKIIEATNSFSGAVFGIFPFGRKALIKESERSLDFTKDRIHVVVYKKRVFENIKVASRAKAICEAKGTTSKYDYHLLDNNCEHFATFCVTGKKFSLQNIKVELVARLFVLNGFVGLSDERKRNEFLHERKHICNKCYKLNEPLLNVSTRPITSADDVAPGDIIRYYYWNLLHDAVVLETEHSNKTSMKCRIAHYAFCGLFSHRTIKDEEVTLPFDGSQCVLEYKTTNFEVYETEKVIARARSRVGEQRFVFFSNDTSHFARWCKLPRIRRGFSGQSDICDQLTTMITMTSLAMKV
ncbi:uncharacterized protein LOC128241839 [Mya arenaria]|uniref:uncharacterized protein LOC128241839 n=1 Tax=Mya arenaria TaxID=6604 RepID=UPI0022E1BF45|nr:uncharacterized protein LOC128241839 [Mya arenaria]